MAAKPLTKRPLRRGSTAWLRARRKHGGLFRIGSSEAPLIVLGEHHGRTQLDLWLEKMGQSPEAADEFDLRQGRALEEVCAKEAAQALGAVRSCKGPGVRLRRRRGIMRHPKRAWMIASLDRVLTGLDSFEDQPLKGPGLLECKAPRYAGMLRVKQDGLPPAALIQVLHQLEVTGWGWGLCAHYHRDFGVLLHLVRRDQHQSLTSEIIRREKAFWSCLQAGETPPPLGKDLQPVKVPPQFRQATAWRDGLIWQVALRRLEQAREKKDAAEAEWTSTRRDLQFLMGNMQEVHTPWGQVSWKQAKPSARLDSKLMRAELTACAQKIAVLIERPLAAQDPESGGLIYGRADMAALLVQARGLPRLVERALKPAAPSRPFIAKFKDRPIVSNGVSAGSHKARRK